MRSFEDSEGRRWDVAVGKESYGAQVLIFSVRGGDEIRRGELVASNALDAHHELEALSDDELRARLADAQGWT